MRLYRRLSRPATIIGVVALTAACASGPPIDGASASPPAPSVAAPTALPATPVATAAAPPSPGAASLTPDAATAARADLDNLLRMLDVTHPEPFHGIDRAAWVGELDRLADRLESLDRFEAQVELQRVVALLSRAGRDGHQWALPLDAVEAPALPLRVYEFAEGVFITAAMPPHDDLAGRRILAINGHPIDAVLAAVEPLVPRDGPATVPGFRPSFMLRTSVLRGLGLIDAGDVRLTVEDADGDTAAVHVTPVPFAEWTGWAGDFGRVTLPTRADTLYLSRPGPTLWARLLNAAKTYYIRYETVAPLSRSDIEEMRAGASAESVERVVLDLRHNPGGDNGEYPPLLDLLGDPGIDRVGRLFVLTDRLTFSAASNLATQLEQQTTAVFAGEPMGGGLNFWNDVTWVALPSYPVPMRVGVSTRYWQMSTADDRRLTIDPDVPVAVRAADYFSGRDPVLEAVSAD